MKLTKLTLRKLHLKIPAKFRLTGLLVAALVFVISAGFSTTRLPRVGSSAVHAAPQTYQDELQLQLGTNGFTPAEVQRAAGTFAIAVENTAISGEYTLQPTQRDKRAADMANIQMTEEQLLQLLKYGEENGYITGSLPSDPRELEQLAQSMLKDMIHQEPSEDEKQIVPGWQQLILKREPAGDWNDATDRRLPLFFEGREWSALFYDVLRCPSTDPFKPGDNIDEWTQKRQIKFQEPIPDYPMLGRMWDTYIDVTYQPGEVSQLRDECRRVRATTSSSDALRGLDKLMYACDEAIQNAVGLQLLSD